MQHIIIHTKRSGVFSSLTLIHVPKHLLPEFAKALIHWQITWSLQIFMQRERPITSASPPQILQKQIRELGTPCEYFPTFDEIENFLLENCTHG